MAAVAGVGWSADRRRGEEEEAAAEHAAYDPLQHRPSLGDVTRVNTRRRRWRKHLLAVAAHAPAAALHGVGFPSEWRAEDEIRWEL